MSQPTITYTTAMAAARDAGDRSMKAAGRTVWARIDWETACTEFERLQAWQQRCDSNAPEDAFLSNLPHDT